MNNNLQKLEEKIQYNFINKDLIRAALTHTSYINEQAISKEETIHLHNERLEFLGDAVLEIVISEELYKRYSNDREGILTHTRSTLVNEKTLGALAKELSLDKYLLLGKGEEAQGGRQRLSILSDTLEALIAAIYLDAQENKSIVEPLQPVRKLIHSLYSNLWLEELQPKKNKDFKTLLQEKTQSLFKDTPKYSLLSCDGPEHQKIFTIEVVLPNGKKITKSATNKKRAEQQAAEEALDILN